MRKAARPKLTQSPARTVNPESARQPLTLVPFVEPRSTSTQASSVRRSSAWCHETVMSPRGRSQFGEFVRALGMQGAVHPLQEGFVRDAASDGSVAEHPDHLIALLIGDAKHR